MLAIFQKMKEFVPLTNGSGSGFWRPKTCGSCGPGSPTLVLTLAQYRNELRDIKKVSPEPKWRHDFDSDQKIQRTDVTSIRIRQETEFLVICVCVLNLRLTLGRAPLCSLTQVCVLQHKWLNAIGQSKDTLDSLATRL
jgi:hypothetical protein